jgi:simple sugar transport system ATP-binding protein
VNILILDEPTAVLTPQETDELFRALRRLVEEGRSIIFISHKLQEVMSISNRATVLRNGRVVGTAKVEEMEEPILATMMVGREVERTHSGHPLSDRAKQSPGAVVLSVREVETETEGRGLQKLSFDVRSGEIFGVAGVDGNGQTELADVLIGMLPVASGRLLMDGVDITDLPLKERLRRGVAFIPQDRQAVGLIPHFTVAENLILQTHGHPPCSRRGFFSVSAVRSSAEHLRATYNIRTVGVNAPVETLSGGNQQKVILARELSRSPRLLIALNPTRGVDIGATQEVHSRLKELKRSGGAVVLISTELDEIVALSDRVGVLYNGTFTGIVPPEIPREEIGLLMGGIRKT